MMSRTITLELPEAVVTWMETSAHQLGMTPSDWIVFTLTQQSKLQRQSGSSQVSSPPTSPDALTRLAANHEADDVEAATVRKRFREHFGQLNTGNPHSADNEEIDADLARACSDPPREDV